jgi:autotransporter-associated beta strand protein
LIFGTSSTTALTDNLMTPSTYSIAGITFNSGAPAYVINSGTAGVNGFTLTGGITNNGANIETINDLIATTAVRTITLTSGGGNITLGGNISGSGGGFTTAGAGTLTLSGNESFTGALTVGASTTVILSGSNGARPAGTNNLTVVNNGGVLQLQANPANTVSGTSYALSSEETANSPLELNSGATVQLRSDSNVTFAGANNLGGVGSATITFDVNQLTSAGSNNTLTFAPGGITTFNTTINVTGGNGDTLALGPIAGDSSTLTLNPTSGNLTIGGVISAVSTLTKNGAGTLTFSAANTYTGGTTISAGVLLLNNALAAQDSIVTISAGTGTLGTNNGLQFQSGLGDAFTIGGLSGASNEALLDTAGSNVALTIGNNNDTGMTYSGALSGGGSLTKVGTGTQTLSGANTYTGTTSVSAGTISLTGTLNGSSVSTSGAGALTESAAGVIAGSGVTFTQGSAAVSTLGGANTYTGGTTISGGALEFSANSAMPATGTVAVGSGGTLAVPFANAGSIGGLLAGTGFQGAPVTWAPGASIGFDTTAAGGTYASVISNPGANALGFSKLGSNTLTLTATNTYTGNTTIFGGTLAIGGAGQLGSTGAYAGNISNAGTFNYNSTAAQTLSGVISGAGALTQSGAGALTLSGSNNYSGVTTLNGGTLLLVANAGNTSGGVTSALSNSSTELALGVNTTLALQGNTTNTIFEPSNSYGTGVGSGQVAGTNGNASTTTGVYASGNGTFNFSAGDTDGGVTTGNTLILGNFGQFGAPGASPTFNFAVNNGYTLQIGSGTAGTGSLFDFDTTAINSTVAGGTLSIPGGIAINYNVTYTLNFGGAGNFSVGALTIPTGGMIVNYGGTGTLLLTGANTYTGLTTINGGGTIQVGNGSTGSLHSGNALTFSGFGGTINFDEAASSSQAMGTLTVSAGDVTVESTNPGSGTTTLTFSNVAARAAGSTINFVTNGGVNGTSNLIVLTDLGGSTTPTGALLGNGYFFDGSNYAAYSTGGYVRAYSSGDTGYVTAAGSNNIANTTTNDVALTGNATSQASADINALNMGAYTLALANAAAFETNGILESGNGSSTISGGASLSTTTSSGELVIRTNLSTDSLNISTPIINNGTTSLTKSGAGTLTLSGAETYTGATTVAGGTLSLTGSLTGSSITTSGAGVLTEGATGVIAGSGVTFTQGSSGLSTLSGSNTYTGATTLSNGTLELVANSTNTSGGVSYALGTSTALTQSFGTTLTLLSNGNAIFKPSSVGYTAGGSDIYNMYVGNNGSGTGNTLVLANVGQFLASSAAPVFNLSGANGYTLQLGSGTAGTGGLSIYNSTTFNSNTVGVTLSIPGGIAYDHTGGYVSTFGGVGNISVGAIVQDGSPGEILVYDGTATLTLTGANTYFGTTTVSSGTLQVGNGSTGSLSTSSALSVSSGATLAFDEANNGSQSNTIANAGTVAGVEVLGSTNTLSGIISSTGGFTQSGAGTTILSGDDTYTGATNVTAGLLSLTGTLGAGSGGGTAISNGATFTESTAGVVTGASSVTNTAGTTTLGGINSYTGATNVNGGTLTLTGTIGAGSTGSAITNAATFNESTAGVVTGSSSFSNTAGTATLAGANNYSGATNVTGGTLNLSGTYSGTGAVTVSGAGTLNLTGSSSSASATYAISSGGTLAGTGYIKGAVTVAGGATLLNTSGGTLTLGNGLTLGSPISGSAILNFAEGGLNPSLLQLGSGMLTVNTGGAVLNISSLGGIAANQAYNLIDFGSGPAAGVGTSVDGLSLGTTPSIFGVSGYSLTVSSSAVQLTTTGASAPSTAFWSGTFGSQWNLNNGTIGNFTTDSAGTNFVNALPAATTNVIFSGSNASNFTNTLGQAFTINSLTFTGSNGSNAVTIAADGNTLTVGSGGVLVQSGAGPVTLGVNLAGAATVTDNNSTYLALLGTNSYTGGTVINSGTVQVNSGNSLGASSGAVTMSPGTTLEALNTASSANNFALSGDPTIQVDSGVYTITGVLADGTSSGTLEKSGTGTLTLAAAETYSGATKVNAGTLQLGNGTTDGTLNTSGVLDNAALVYDAILTDTASYVISGSGSVTMNGSGTVILAGANTYGGPTTVSAGTLQIGNGSTGSLSGSTSVTVSGGTLAFDMANSASYSGNISDTGTVAGAEGAGITNTLGGAISGAGGAFTQSGAGTTILSGANSYTGATTVSGGTLSLTGSLAGSSVSTSGTGVFAESSTGAISGAGATFTQGSTGASTLSGSNTYAGATTLSSGTLVLVANSTNTSGGVTSALSNFSSELLLSGNGTLSLLGNTSNTIFEPATAGIVETGGGPFNISAGGSGATGTTLILGNFGEIGNSTGSPAYNFAVNNNYILEIGAGSAGTGTLGFVNNPTINSTVAGGTLSIPGGMFVNAPHPYILTFGGAGNIIVGALNNQGGAALALTSTSAGTVTLTGANGYTNATTVGAGTLQVGNGSAGSLNDASAISVSSGATLAFDEANNGSQTQAIADAGTVAGVELVGSTNTLSGIISSTGGFTQSGAGTTILSGDDTYIGATSVTAGGLSLTGTLTASSVTTSGGGILTETSGGQIAGSGVTFTQGSTGTSILSGANTYGGLTTVSGGTLSLGGTLTASSVTTSGAGIFTESSGGVIAGSGASFTQGSSGTSILSGANTYAGATTVNGGILQAGVNSVSGVSGAFGKDSAVTVTAGGTLALNGFTTEIGSLSDGGGTGGSVTLGSATLTDVTTASTSFSGNISGAGGFTVNGSGVQTLTGSNGYSGATNIGSNATLQLGNGTSGNDGTIGNTSVVNDSGTLIFNRAGANTASYKITGGGNVTVSGSGSQTLSNSNNNYSGTTTVNGTLIVAGALTGNGPVNINNGGTLGGGFSAIPAIYGNVNIASGGNLYPSFGLQTAGNNMVLNSNLTLSSSANVTINLGANGSLVDTITADGANNGGSGSSVTLSGDSTDTLTIYLLTALSAPPASFDFLYTANASDTPNGNFALNAIFAGPGNNGGYAATVGWDAGNDAYDVTFTAVPEPGTWGMLLGGAGMLVAIQRMRRRNFKTHGTL